MRKTIDQLTAANQRLQAQVAGQPVVHMASTDAGMLLGGGMDLHAEEHRLLQAYKEAGNNLDLRRQIQTRLTAVQQTLYAKR